MNEKPSRNRGKRAESPKVVLSMVLMVVMSVYFLFPIYWLVISSAKSTQALLNTSAILPSHLALISNLHAMNAESHGIYWRWFLNSIIYAGVTSVLGTLISAMAAYALVKFKFPFNRTLLNIVIAGLAVPATAFVLPVFLIMKEVGLLNTYIGVILPMLVNPFGVFFLSVYIKDAMPTDLMDSGKIDGANAWQIFRSIAIPVIRPGLVTLLLILFISTWNNFFLPLVLLSNQKLFPVTLGLDQWVSTLFISSSSSQTPVYGVILLGSVISILPMIVLFPLLRRYIVSGLTMGGIKA